MKDYYLNFEFKDLRKINFVGSAFSERSSFVTQFRTEVVSFVPPCGVMSFLKDLDGRYVLEMHCIIFSPQNVEPTVFPPFTPLTFLPLKSCINTHLPCGWTRARQNCCFFCFVSSAEIKKGRSCWAILALGMLLLYLVTEKVQPVNLVCRKWEFGGLEY